MVRIITGSAKNIQLEVPHQAIPVSDRAKASIFSVIGTDIIDRKILDLYAGSGSFGIEALSRGAAQCTFVESSRYATIDIKRNLSKAKLSDKALVTHRKVFQFLDDEAGEQFDIVFADPPFEYYKDGTSRIERLLYHIDSVIPAGGAIVIKHPATLKIPEHEGLLLADQRRFGAAVISLWVKMREKE